MKRVLFIVTAWYVALCIAAWPFVPERIPMHFNAAGVVDRWVDKSVLAWFGLPILGVALVLAMYYSTVGIMRLSERQPHLWNVPEKKKFLALPHEVRLPLLRRMSDLIVDFIAEVSIVLIAIFAWAQLTMLLVARGVFAGLSWSGIAVAILLIAYSLVRGMQLNAKIREWIRSAG